MGVPVGVTEVALMPGMMTMGPIGLLVVYGLARGGAVGCNELRNSIFAKVAQVGFLLSCQQRVLFPIVVWTLW